MCGDLTCNMHAKPQSFRIRLRVRIAGTTRNRGSVVVHNRLAALPDDAAPSSRHAAFRAMSLTATARSVPGTLRQEVLIDGTHRLLTDEPERLGGSGTAPAPHEL